MATMNSAFDPAHLSRFLALAAIAFCGGVKAAGEGPVPPPAPRYIVGGITDDERTELRSQVERHSLWLVTAVSRTGAYLADVRVRLWDERHRLVFDDSLSGPWLLIDLAPGRYDIEATFGDQTQRRATTLHAGDHRQVLLYFDAEGDVLDRKKSVTTAP